MTRNSQAIATLGLGGAIAMLALFALRVVAPEIHAMMDDMEKQAATLVVAAITQRVWSILDPIDKLRRPKVTEED